MTLKLKGPISQIGGADRSVKKLFIPANSLKRSDRRCRKGSDSKTALPGF